MCLPVSNQAVFSVNPRADWLLKALPTQMQNCRQATIFLGLPLDADVPHRVQRRVVSPPSGHEHHLTEAERSLDTMRPDVIPHCTKKSGMC